MWYFSNPGNLQAMMLDAACLTEKGDPTVINGQPAIAVKYSGGAVVYVATTGTPYLLRENDGEQIDLSDFDGSFSISAPNADAVIDSSTLGDAVNSCLN